jgi:hypothetical protein
MSSNLLLRAVRFPEAHDDLTLSTVRRPLSNLQRLEQSITSALLQRQRATKGIRVETGTGVQRCQLYRVGWSHRIW